MSEWNGHSSFDIKQYKSVTTYSYVTSGGVYYGGQVVSSSSTNSHRDLSGSSWGSWTSDPGSSSANTYILRDSPLMSTNTLTTSTTASEYFLRRYHKDPTATIYTSTYNYDANNNLSYVAVADGKPRMMTYLSTSDGQRVWTKETLGTTAVTGLKSAFDGSVFGTGVFNGMAWYGKSETPATAFDAQNDLMSSGIDVRKLYDGGYQAVTPDGVPSTAGAYVVQAGDTLQSIAAQTWGDSSLWYMIAEANGLSGSGQIAAGQRLTIPNKIANFHNTGDTFRPYNASDNMGAVAPNRAAPPKPKKAKCGGLGAVLMIFVAAVVAIYVGPQIAAHFLEGAASGSTAFATAATAEAAASLTTLGGVVTGAATGALSSFASQMFGVAADIQDKIDWKAVGMTALGGAISGGLGASKMFGKATLGEGAVGNVTRGVVGNIASQAIGVRLGLQDRFDWTGVAAAGIGGLTGSWASAGIEGMKGEAFYALGNAVGDAGTRSLIDGTSFGDNLKAALPSVIGQTIGNMLATGIAQAEELKTRQGIAGDAVTAIERTTGVTLESQAYREAVMDAVINPSKATFARMDEAASLYLEASRSNPEIAAFLAYRDQGRLNAEYNGDMPAYKGSREFLLGRTIDHAGIWVGETGAEIAQRAGQFIDETPGLGIALKLSEGAFAVAAPGKYLAGKALDYFKDEATDYIADKMTGPRMWTEEKGHAGGAGFVLAGSLVLSGTALLRSLAKGGTGPSFPPNNGFLAAPRRIVMEPGQVIDRYGGTASSKFFSPPGTSLAARSLPPETASLPLRTFKVAKPFHMKSGTVAPWYNQPGMGTQFQSTVGLQKLLDKGYLVEVTR